MQSHLTTTDLCFGNPDTVATARIALLRQHLAHCLTHSPYYQRTLSSHTIHPNAFTPKDLPSISLTTKTSKKRATMKRLHVALLGLLLSVPAISSAQVNSDTVAPMPKDVRLQIKLVGGALLVGLPKTEHLPFQMPFGRIDMPWKQIHSLTINDDHKGATLSLLNGDKLTGILSLENVLLGTQSGDMNIEAKQIKRLNVIADVAKRKAGEVLILDVNGADLEMAWIPAGEFSMGSPTNERGRLDNEPQHKVTLSKGFWAGKYEVTQALWKKVMGNNPSHFNAAQNPVEQVSWNDCQEFIVKLNKLIPDAGFRLPSEAQWEYACRAGTATTLNNGTDLTSEDARCPNLDTMSWYNMNSGETTQPVGQKKANAWGLYDMSGNVWEWCEDQYSPYPPPAFSVPTGPTSGVNRVARGGSWNYSAKNCRSSNRGNRWPDGRYFSIGFRLCMTQEF